MDSSTSESPQVSTPRDALSVTQHSLGKLEYSATEYTFNHLGLEPHLQPNIAMSYYEAGHMMYVHDASLKKLSEDVAAFVEKAR